MAGRKNKRRVVQGQGRELVAKVFHYLKEEYKFTELYKEPNCDLSHLRNITKRTAEATGTSMRTVQKILQEERELPSGAAFRRPLKNRRKRPCKVDIDGRLAYTVRSSVREHYVVYKQIPTIEKIKSSLKEKIGYEACIGTIRKLLLKLGYTWTKSDIGRKALIERHDVQLARLQYLKKITECRSQGRPIVFADESYVMTKDVKVENWTPRATRYILAHAGTTSGFIDNACLVYPTPTVSGDDHAKMNFEYYQKWLDEKLLPNIPDNSVIVLDSTSFQNIPVETLPTMHADKSKMQEWLTSKGINFDANLCQIELYDLIKQHKNAFTTYKIDNYIKGKGFEVLRLPPNLPELNAILSIWETVKNHIVTVEHDVNHTEKVIKYCVDKISSETWRYACELVHKKEKEYLEHFDTGYVFLANLQDEIEDESESEGEGSDADTADESP